MPPLVHRAPPLPLTSPALLVEARLYRKRANFSNISREKKKKQHLLLKRSDPTDSEDESARAGRGPQMALLALRTALMAGSASIAARASLCASLVPHGAKLEGRELHSLVKTLKSRAGAGAGTGRAPRLSPDRVSSRQSTSESTSAVPEPNRHQLWAHAVRCAIPMVGFGIIDNVVMITAGERIQSSIGLTLGLTTMAAAGLGQIVSDISGIMSGGTVDALVGRLLPNLPRAGLTSLQKDLTSARIAQTAGGCVGVTVGCLLGMSVLLLLDAEAVERQRTAAELERIFDLVERSAMNTVDRTLG